MVRDDFDRLARGKRFTQKNAWAVKDGEWIDVTAAFDTEKLKYYVKLQWGSDSVREWFDSAKTADARFESLVVEHDLN